MLLGLRPIEAVRVTLYLVHSVDLASHPPHFPARIGPPVASLLDRTHIREEMFAAVTARAAERHRVLVGVITAGTDEQDHSVARYGQVVEGLL